MNVVRNVELKKGLKRPDISIRRLAKDDTVFAIIWQNEIDVMDGDRLVMTLRSGFKVKPLKQFIAGKSRKDLEALYQNMLYDMCNVWLARFASK